MSDQAFVADHGMTVFSELPDGTLEPLPPRLVPEGLTVRPERLAPRERRNLGPYHDDDIIGSRHRWRRDKNGELFRVEIVSDDPEVQARYLAFRADGKPHHKAKWLAHRHPDLVLTDEELGRLDAANLADTEDERDEANRLPYRENDPACPFHHYQRMRIDGQSHKMAIMLASRSFPGVRTDATFNTGRCNGNQFADKPALGDHYRRIAEAAGVSTTGKHYCSGLADFPGDPTAWISDRGDVLRVAREKGYRVSGDVEYDPGEREPMPDVAIDPAIVENAVDIYMAEQPGERRADVEERFTELLSGAVDPNPLLVQDPPPDFA